ncbi:pupal cuticle protein 36-like [Manduca sexta]|uniref:pupal cuticle protein 36-like n=1 Tax=Manduca sexta TaxID=7130 RepID=UPI00188F5CF2|nr:pupal cuticle protein 36-like [Manduca sexta]
MKLFILLAAVAVCNAAKLDKTYLPPHAQSSGGSGGILQAPGLDARQGLNPFGANRFGPAGNGAPAYSQSAYEVANRAERPRAALERNAAILRQDNSNDGERYSYAYETENGIYAEENGVATNGVEAQGGFAYTGDDGQLYSIKYTADQNGFVPQGDHLPTPPLSLKEILRALEQNARDEAAGIYDDGEAELFLG